jgi:hypothetical protein
LTASPAPTDLGEQSKRLQLGEQIVESAHGVLFAGLEAALARQQSDARLAIELHRLAHVRSQLRDVETQLRSFAEELKIATPLQKGVVEMQIRVCKTRIVDCYAAIDPSIDRETLEGVVDQVLASFGATVPNSPPPAEPPAAGAARGRRKPS